MKDYIVFGSPEIGEQEIAAVREVLETCWIGSGPKVNEFEKQFADYIGVKHAVALNSCTAGLHLSMVCSDINPGDEVITTPLTFAATANSIVHVGAVPVFVDVDKRTMNIDTSRIEAAITPKTKAIVPVHFAGRPCEMDVISGIAEKYGLVVVEDAAHCVEGKYHGKKIGTISPLTCFSFYVTKNMTTAEGGMICTNDDAVAERIKVNGLHGLSIDAWKRFSDEGYRHYEVVYPGFKYNMTDIAAAIGLCQLPKLDKWMKRREQIWEVYDDAFQNLPCLTPEPVNARDYHARHLYTVLIDLKECKLNRDEVITALHNKGIGTGVHYRAVHLHEYYKKRFGYEPDDFANANWISERTLSLPLSAKLTDGEVTRIIDVVSEVLSS